MATDFLGIQIPFLDLLGLRMEVNAKGESVMSVELRPELMNSLQVAHGGVVMTLLDVAMAAAARSTADNKGTAVTVDMSLNFMRAAKGRVVAVGRVLKGGKSLVFCEAEARDATGEMVAKSMGTFKLHRGLREGEGN